MAIQFTPDNPYDTKAIVWGTDQYGNKVGWAKASNQYYLGTFTVDGSTIWNESVAQQANPSYSPYLEAAEITPIVQGMGEGYETTPQTATDQFGQTYVLNPESLSDVWMGTGDQWILESTTTQDPQDWGSYYVDPIKVQEAASEPTHTTLGELFGHENWDWESMGLDPNTPVPIGANPYVYMGLSPGETGMGGQTTNILDRYEDFLGQWIDAGATYEDIMLANRLIGGLDSYAPEGADVFSPHMNWLLELENIPGFFENWSTLSEEQKTQLFGAVEAARVEAAQNSDDSFWSDNLMGTIMVAGGLLGLNALAPALTGAGAATGAAAGTIGTSAVAGVEGVASQLSLAAYDAAISAGFSTSLATLAADTATALAGSGLTSAEIIASAVETASSASATGAVGTGGNIVGGGGELVIDAGLGTAGAGTTYTGTGADYGYEVGSPETTGGYDQYPGEYPTDTPPTDYGTGADYGYEVGSPETTGGYDIPTGSYPEPSLWEQITQWVTELGLPDMGDLGSWGEQLLTSLTGSLTNFFGTGDGSGGLLDLLNDAFGAYAAYDYSDQMEDFYKQAIEAVRWKDPFWDALAKQTGTYGVGGTAYGDAIANSVSREQAAAGYGFSGNMLHELAQGLNSASLDAIKTFDTAARPTQNVYGDMFSDFGPAISSQYMNTAGAISNMLGGGTSGGSSGGGFDWGSVFDTAWDWLSNSSTDDLGWPTGNQTGVYL